jgi:hypothetical protein
MKKIALILSVMSLSAVMYAGDACCDAKKTKEKVEKKVCAECSKAEGTCDACKAKAEKAVKAEVSTEKKD